MKNSKQVAGFLITATAGTTSPAGTTATAAAKPAKPAKASRAVASRPRAQAQAPSKKEVQAARFYDRAMDYGSDLVDRHAFIATVGAAAAGHQISKRVFDPAGRAIARTVKGVMAKKVTDKVTNEVKGAFSIGDVADGIAGAFGRLL